MSTQFGTTSLPASLPTITSSNTQEAIPAWAFWQRHLLATMSEAALFFADRYTKPDGSLVWARSEWKGMDGSDDAYENVYNFPLLYFLGGAAELLPLAQHGWDGVTRQFTAYGQVHREFDAYYDWMHHGESSLALYYLALAGADGAKNRDRARRFADFYTGADATTPNYDPIQRLLRSPLTGSRGPRLETSAEDWAELRGIYSQYPAPFDDLPGLVDTIADWTDPLLFGEILEKFNARLAKGDVPINLLATTLATHAFLATGDARDKAWVLDYMAAWAERTAQNGGVTPDNVGLSGQVGETLEGRWWGGYYGWGWPHGGQTLLEALAVAGMNATMLTGDNRHLDLFRSQWDWLWAQGRDSEGQWHLPFWREENGWRSYRPANPRLPIAVWSLTQDANDLARIERFRGQRAWNQVKETGWGDESSASAWYRFACSELVEGIGDYMSDFPEQVLQATCRHVTRRLEMIRHEPLDPNLWPPVSSWENDVHHWLNRNPISCEGLVLTALGAPMPIFHGGLLHAQVSYYDEAAGRPGLPAHVAALVVKVHAQGVVLHLSNLNPTRSAAVVVRAGNFGEHLFIGVTDLSNGKRMELESAGLRVELMPAASLRIRMDMQRFARQPHYPLLI